MDENKKLSRLLLESKAKSEYKNPLTGTKLELKERKVKNKKLNENITGLDSFFTNFSSLEWTSSDHVPGNHNCKYAKLPGILEMGLVKLEQNGLLHLHWHKGKLTKISSSIFE